MEQKEQFVSEFADLISKKTKQRILSVALKSLSSSEASPIGFPIREEEKIEATLDS